MDKTLSRMYIQAIVIAVITLVIILLVIYLSVTKDNYFDMTPFKYTPRCKYVDYGGHNTPHYYHVPEIPGFGCRGITSGAMPSIDPVMEFNNYCARL